jgi:predicted Zn finger-like uncharacterized protein
MPDVLFSCPNCTFSKKISQKDVPPAAKQCKCPSCDEIFNLSEALKPLGNTDNVQQTSPGSVAANAAHQLKGASMLEMKCSECNGVISSALLADLEEVNCNHCQALVPIKDLTVSANGFTYYCADLKKRLPHYKSLLKNFTAELKYLEKDPDASSKRKHSLDKTVQALKTGMATTRNNCRIHFADEQLMKYRSDSQIEIGKLVNISMTGACIELMPSSTAPRKNSQMTIMFSLPDKEHVFSLNGVIRWCYDGSFGISFDAVKPEEGTLLWEYIATSTLGYVPYKACDYAV